MKFPNITIVAAVNRRWAIGLNGGLPWDRIPADMSRFRRLTGTKPIIMGRRTHESIGRALPNRRNIVLSSRWSYNPIDCDCVPSLSHAILLVQQHEPEVCVIGGGLLFEDVLAIEGIDLRMHLTFIDDETDGDVFFPKFDQRDFHVIGRERVAKGTSSPYNLEFIDMIKRTPRHD